MSKLKRVIGACLECVAVIRGAMGHTAECEISEMRCSLFAAYLHSGIIDLTTLSSQRLIGLISLAGFSELIFMGRNRKLNSKEEDAT